MKNFSMHCICCLVVVLALTACTPPSVDTGTAANPLRDFKEHIAVAEGPIEVKEYLDALMEVGDTKSALDTATADALVLEYLNYLEEFLMRDQEDLSNYPTQAGLKFAVGEGGDYPVIDYHFIDAYAGRVSREITDYAGFMALDSDKPWAIDAGLVISPRQLADRIALAERFAVGYPDSVLRDRVLEQYEYYLGAFLAGLPNTPLYPFETAKADSEFIDAYDYFAETYPDLITAETVRDYQVELKQKNYTAPYAYSDSEKRAEFSDHIYDLVQNALGRLNQ